MKNHDVKDTLYGKTQIIVPDNPTRLKLLAFKDAWTSPTRPRLSFPRIILMACHLLEKLEPTPDELQAAYDKMPPSPQGRPTNSARAAFMKLSEGKQDLIACRGCGKGIKFNDDTTHTVRISSGLFSVCSGACRVKVREEEDDLIR